MICRTMLCRLLTSILLLTVAIPALQAAPQVVSQNKEDSTAVTGTKVLTAADATKILPGAVFFRGQSAAIQARNSGGVRFTKDALLLVTLVDTAGYSSSLQEKYQAYLITEVPINIGAHRLEPGAYGCGFVSGNAFVIMDIGGHDLFTAPSSKDVALRRPTPLQILPAPDGVGRFRLYLGRDYVVFSQAATVKATAATLHQ